jgi:uncharacterized protein (TIGR01777 family)
MNYLVTGATGFIGSRLVNAVLSAGHRVNYLGRKRSKTIESRAAFHCWSAGEKPPLNSVPRLDTVIHLAGEPVAQRWTGAAKKRIYESRVVGTRDLVSAIAELKHKPATLVCASAIGYYGSRGDEILTEQSKPGSGFLSDLCVQWEQEAAKARKFGLRVVSIRISAVLGREGGALRKMLTPFRLGVGGKLGSGRQWMSWIHIDDLVRLLVFAAEGGAVKGALNGASPNPVTNAEFTRMLSRVLRRPAPWAIPPFALKAAFGEMAEVLLDSARVLPVAAEEAGFQFEYPHLRKALEECLSKR